MADFDELMESLERTMRALETDKQKQQAVSQRPRALPVRWNIVAGCPGTNSVVCRNCMVHLSWFDRFARSTGGFSLKSSSEGKFLESRLMDPLKIGKSNDVEVAPLSDLFNGALSNKQLDQIFTVMKLATQHRFFVTTKFPIAAARYIDRLKSGHIAVRAPIRWPLSNVFIGVSVEDQGSYRERVSQLMHVDTLNRYVVFEPLLERIDDPHILLPHGDLLDPFSGFVYEDQGDGRHAREPSQTLHYSPLTWVIIGGALHEGGLPPHPAWVQKLIVHAQSLNIPVWFKGWGRYAQTDSPRKDEDDTLVLMNSDGTTRGRGVGSKTNHLAEVIDGEKSVFFTRRAPIDMIDVINGRTIRERPPAASGRTMPGMRTDELRALKQHMMGRSKD